MNHRDDALDVRFSRVLDDGLETGNEVLDEQDLVQLLAVLDDDDVGLAVDGAVQARLGRVRRVHARREAPTTQKKIGKTR